MNRRGPILIAGAGIGGLTAAYALIKKGFDVRVVERAPRFRPLGAGLMVQINGMLALRHLDLDERVKDRGVELEHLTIQRYDGKVLFGVAVAPLAREFGMPMVAIHRRQLHEVLFDAVGRDRILFGADARGFTEEETWVRLELGRGSSERGAALIGADGLCSAVRSQLLNDPLRYSGYTSWRGICPRTTVGVDNAVTEMWGCGCRFGFVPIGSEEIYWFAVNNAPAGETEGPHGPKQFLLDRLESFREPVKPILEATPAENILRTDVYDRVPAGAWGRGHVTLLGDAAHPMLPDVGQGACQAIEDGVVLARRLASSASIESGLREYERSRLGRTTRIVKQARLLGRIAQWENPLACRLRNLLAGWAPDTVSLKEMRKHWSFDPDV